MLTAYSPLGSDNSPLLKNEIVNKIGDAHGVAAANVLISLHANTPGVTGTFSIIFFDQVALTISL